MVTLDEATRANERLFNTARATCELTGGCNEQTQERQRERCAAAMDFLCSAGKVTQIGINRVPGQETCVAVEYAEESMPLQSVSFADYGSCPTVIWYTALRHAEILNVPFVEMMDGRVVSLAVIDDARKEATR